ncbi:globin-coupled sensor protein [Gluconacetobacter azotocaptans]|uniref:Globin-coupled sensor protein n=1 Tax=Gluconacetobacter azotocaptans TaxID=142834 RepID=A0A7W4PGM8_9PROT|nr:globin-coupled sensor protein [Gluconacetobacter azotocaptans]MBB2190156.1 globin-coupled sensor protein [Gluconacetobacter azotocaptans]GBQ27248.1 methyl-accepting chemotaxis protein [Gluconacetobacter azotocaptans DSM 13594]
MIDNVDRDTRLGFLQIDETTRASLREFRPVLEKHIDTVLDAFYSHVARAPEAARIFVGKRIDHARDMQRIHWLDNVFSGAFNEHYFRQAVNIGRIHQRVGLEPRWYMAGYCFTINKLVGIASTSYQGDPERLARIVTAINKAAFLDMDLAISVYIDAGKEAAAVLMGQHADSFEREIASTVNIVAEAATRLRENAQSMAESTGMTAKQSNAVAVAAQQVSSNVQVVAASTEQLSSSIQDISAQVGQSASISTSAVDEAQNTNAIVQSLEKSVGQIGDVVKLINNIARQTKILAVNASIEAARAGDEGRGFAVVAMEIKNLANQTAQATDEIAAQIVNVQGATSDAVGAIQNIGTTIGKINEIAGASAATVKEQGAVTQEISRNIHEVSQSTSMVTRSISQVTQAADASGRTGQDVAIASAKLSRQSEILSEKVNSFLIKVRHTN